MAYVNYGGYYGSIGTILQQWADFGVFAYLLPFLMIFAVVYGILTKSKILGDNRGVNATIALTIGLLALQFDYVSNFFATIFPYTGMGLAVLLIALILMGLVSKENDNTKWIWFGIGGIIFIIVLLTSLNTFPWWGYGYGLQGSWPAILSALLVLGVLALIIFGDKLFGKGS